MFAGLSSGVSLAVVAFLVSDACAWKAIKPICDTNGKVTGWQDEQIRITGFLWGE